MLPLNADVLNAARTYAQANKLSSTDVLGSPKHLQAIATEARVLPMQVQQTLSQAVQQGVQWAEDIGIKASSFTKQSQVHNASFGHLNGFQGVVGARMNQTLLPSANERSVLADGLVKVGSMTLTDAGAKVRQAVVDTAHKALGAPTFKERNDVHATAIGKESALLAAHSMGKPAQLERIAPVFIKAAKDAGNAFAAAFTDGGKVPTGADGKPTQAATDAYNSAMKAAGGVAMKALQSLDPNAVGVVKKASLGDIAALVARDLGVDASVLGKDLKGTLKGLKDTALKDDYFKDLIDTLPDNKAVLDDKGLDTLAMGVRMANCTWKSGQVHRAAWEGNDSRIDPSKRGGVYNPFDFLKAEKFHSNGADANAFALTVFEVYKDLHELQKAAPTEAPQFVDPGLPQSPAARAAPGAPGQAQRR